MMMVELTSIPAADLPIPAFAKYLRLAEGFGGTPDHSDQLETCLRAAISALEARLGKVFLQRDFIQRVQKWTAADHQTLAVAPVVSIASVKIVRSAGDEALLPAQSYALRQDAHRPQVVSRTGALPMLGLDATAEVTFAAGFTEDWALVPAALRQATFMLAESYFERDPSHGPLHELPCAVCMLVEPFRDIRLRRGSL
jgi:uncharacterized phiE125 gp8 family phage protein